MNSTPAPYCHQIEERIQVRLDGQLSDSDWVELQAHLSKCPSCAREFRWALQTEELLSRALQPTPNALVQSLLARENLKNSIELPARKNVFKNREEIEALPRLGRKG